MDKLHIALIGLLGISIVFLGIGFIGQSSDKGRTITGNAVLGEIPNQETNDDLELYYTDVTGYHIYYYLGAEGIQMINSVPVENEISNEIICEDTCSKKCALHSLALASWEVINEGTIKVTGEKYCSCGCY